MTTQVWYHSNCLDGFGAAYAAWKQFGDDATYIPVQYGYPPPKVEPDDEIYIVDFSYDSETILKLGEQAKQVVLLDHHKTAFDNLAGKMFPTNVRVSLDMERSGAVMAWEFFNPATVIPSLLLHIQDRDLWQWKIPGTKEVCAALDSYAKTFEMWKLLIPDTKRLYQEGFAIVRYKQQQIDVLINAWSKNPMSIELDGIQGPLINGPYFLASELLNQLGANQPFAANMITTAEGILFSLRSSPDGSDVAAIARKYGGGGHKHAAGFKITEEDFRRMRDGTKLAPSEDEELGVLEAKS